MSEDVNNIPDSEEIDNIIVLNDEDGNEVEFEFLDLIEFDGEQYVVLLPTDESEEEESYVSVDDEDILNKVFEIFKEKFKDDFNFIDE